MSATPRTDIDTKEFRTLLKRERARITGVRNEERSERLAESQDHGDSEPAYASADDAADAAASLYDNGRDMAMDVDLVGQIRQIDRALERIDQGTYGICVVTGDPIPVARLRAIPWADMTVEAANRTV